MFSWNTRSIVGVVAIGVAALVLTLPEVAKAGGCEIFFTIVNNQKYPISVRWQDSLVKSQVTVPKIPPHIGVMKVWGTWKKIGDRAHNVAAESSAQYTYNATLGCNLERQYKIYWTGKFGDGMRYIGATEVRRHSVVVDP